MAEIEDDGQTGAFDITIEDSELEEALEERPRARLALAPYKRAYRDAHDAAKFAAKRHEQEIPDGGSGRVGRFRVTKRIVKAKSVSFETGERSQFDFATLEERPGDEPPEQKVARFRAPKKASPTADGTYQVN